MYVSVYVHANAIVGGKQTNTNSTGIYAIPEVSGITPSSSVESLVLK